MIKGYSIIKQYVEKNETEILKPTGYVVCPNQECRKCSGKWIYCYNIKYKRTKIIILNLKSQ